MPKYELVVTIQKYMLDNCYAFLSEVRRQMQFAKLPQEDIYAFEHEARLSPIKQMDVAQKYVNVEMISPVTAGDDGNHSLS